ncbi:hypothetical protein ACWEWU_14770, partial [Staphylococcus xylosus]
GIKEVNAEQEKGERIKDFDTKLSFVEKFREVPIRNRRDLRSVSSSSVSIKNNEMFSSVFQKAQQFADGRLTKDERTLLIRAILRQTSMPKDMSLYNKVLRKNYSHPSNKGRITSKSKKNIEELFKRMKEISDNRNSEFLTKDFIFTSQSQVTKNYFKLVDNSVFVDKDGSLFVTVIFGKERGLGKYRYENFGVRFNKNLNEKLESVTGMYNGKDFSLTEDEQGYYSYTRPDSGENGDPNKNGGSGGEIKYVLKFKSGQKLDVSEDEIYGYILSDTKHPNAVRGVNITTEKINIKNLVDGIELQ